MMDFYMELENKVCVIKYANNLEVFKVHIKDKRFVLDLMKEKLTTNKENIKEGLKSEKNKYLLKKFDVQVKKVDEGPHSNIHQRFNANTMKSILRQKKEKRR